MEKPVIYLQKYEIEEIKLLRNVDLSDDERTLNLDLNIGTTESKKEGRVVLSSKILDTENRRELFVKLAGYFEINIDKIFNEKKDWNAINKKDFDDLNKYLIFLCFKQKYGFFKSLKYTIKLFHKNK